MSDNILSKRGGYRKLKSFQLAQLCYDITVRFCDRYIPKRSRTHDQMVQAARSGVQNIAEGSQVSGTSKKMEMKLTSVARASLEELKLDYEDFLQQRGLPKLEPKHPALLRFKKLKASTMIEVRRWVADEYKRLAPVSGGHTRTQTDRTDPLEQCAVRSGPSGSVLVSTLVANAVHSLLNLTCYLLDRQLAAQATAFEQEGGFTERIYNALRRYRGKGNG